MSGERVLTLHQPWASLVALGVKSSNAMKNGRAMRGHRRGARAVRALTLHQPWASLVSLGVKTIETRSWSTSYRGRLLIHAAQREPERARLGDWQVTRPRAPEDAPWAVVRMKPGGPLLRGVESVVASSDLPLGAVVASCQLVDVVPIVAYDSACRADLADLPLPRIETHPGPPWMPDGELWFWGSDANCGEGQAIHDQAPFGDFTPGRYAWLLDDIKATTERCPRCWGGEIRCTGHHGTDAEPAPCWGRIECGSCGDTHACPPVPMRGRQGLWAPTWDESLSHTQEAK